MSAEQSAEGEQPQSAEPQPSTWRCRRGHVTTTPLVVTLTLPTGRTMRMVGCPQCVADFFEDKFAMRRWSESPGKV